MTLYTCFRIRKNKGDSYAYTDIYTIIFVTRVFVTL